MPYGGFVMTFQQLNYILEIRRTGSVSKTAENLFVTRPSVSLCLRNLEAELGYPIFVRTQQGLVPSMQGELVLEYASRICETQRLITNIGQDRRSRIEIATVSYKPARQAVVRLLQENAGRKDIAFSFKTGYKDVYQKLAFFELDAVITTRFEIYNESDEAQMMRRNLNWRELHRIPVVICIGPGHRLYYEKKLKPHDFDNETLLETPTGALSRCSFLREHIKLDSQRAIITDQSALKYELIAKGLGFSIQRMPSQQIIRQYGFRCIPLEGVYQRLLCVTNPLRPLAPEAQRYLEILEEEVQNYKDVIPDGEVPVIGAI